MSETKLAVILIAILLLIATVPMVLAPSLTGSSYFSLGFKQNTIETPSHLKSLITGYAVQGIPPKDAAIIIASLAFIIVFGYFMYRLFKRQPSSSEETALQQEPTETIEIAEKSPITGEVTADAVLELNQELSVKKRESKKMDYPSLYGDELDKIQRELDSL